MVGTSHGIEICTELDKLGSLIGDYQVYNIIVTAHALIIIFFIEILILIGGFGN
jgi:heme/copper-type cytochrome/quinol oxidase subunit 1